MSCGVDACTLPGRMAGGGCGCGSRPPVSGLSLGMFRQAGGVCPLAMAGYPGQAGPGGSGLWPMRGGGAAGCKCLNKVFGAFKGGRGRRRTVHSRRSRNRKSRRTTKKNCVRRA